MQSLLLRSRTRPRGCGRQVLQGREAIRRMCQV